jgi:predicted ATP-grasp superfamily ATP-dependent carboligase
MNILIGSGFAETISQDITSNRNNYGNNFETIKKTKSKIFFEELRKKNINFPRISKKPEGNVKWLVKEYQSFGGIKVKPFIQSHKINKKEYLQKFIDGDSISVQFFVENSNIKILAICDQIITNSEMGFFLLKSIITKKIQNKLLKTIYDLVKKISKIFALKGINNLDLIIQGKKVFLLEVNPRPGLSTKILDSIHKNLFKIKSPKKKTAFNGYYSSTVIYARKEIKINHRKILFLKKNSHSKQFSELPNLGDIIRVDEPICLLHLKSKNRFFLKKKIEKIQSNFLKKIEET